MLDGLIATLTTTVDQYLSFLLGFRKSKPLMAQVMLALLPFSTTSLSIIVFRCLTFRSGLR